MKTERRSKAPMVPGAASYPGKSVIVAALHEIGQAQAVQRAQNPFSRKNRNREYDQLAAHFPQPMDMKAIYQLIGFCP